MKAIIHGTIFDFVSYQENIYVLFDRAIVEVGPMEQFPGAEEVYDGRGCILMPGLVLGHSHIYSTFARGFLTPFAPQSFRQLLEQMWWKLDGGLDQEAVYHSGLISGIEYIKNGVTTVIDHHASGKSIHGTLQTLKEALCDDMGLRGLFCFETSDRFDVCACIEENIDFAKTQSNCHRGLFGLHASMTLSDQTLREIQKAVGETPIHIHVAESVEDQEDCIRHYGKRVVERLDGFGLLHPGSILAHCIHVNEQELERMARRNIHVALNVTSNMNNGVGLPDYRGMKEKGIPCILGNDGLGYNMARDIHNFVYTMHHRYQNPLDVSLGDMVSVIQNTYGYTGRMLGCLLGRIQPGYEADFMLVPYISPTPMGEENILGHFFYGILDRFHPRDVWCGGEQRMGGYVVQADEGAIYKEARNVSKHVWDIIGG